MCGTCHVQSKYRNASCFESIGLYWINYYYIRCLMFVNLPKSICAYGSKTLAYYVIQGMFAHILSTYLQVNFYQALFLCVCILVLTTVLLRFVDSKFITNPFSTLLKWKY